MRYQATFVLLLAVIPSQPGLAHSSFVDEWVPVIRDAIGAGHDFANHIQDLLKNATARDEAFDKFKNEFSKKYLNVTELQERKEVFKENLERIATLNARNMGWLAGLTPFGDMTPLEFAKMQTLKFLPRPTPPPTTAPTVAPTNGPETNSPTPKPAGPPRIVNWVTTGMARPIRNQQTCGCCWAFATVATVEIQNAIYGSKQVDLSPQQLIDCNVPVNNGCDGGWMEGAYQYLVANNGSSMASAYPYQNSDSSTCNTALEAQTAAGIVSYRYVAPANQEELIKAVSKGAVAVGVDSSNAFQYYAGGIFDDFSLCQDDINHAVVIVGYNLDEGWWLVRNSWGTAWGEQGYIRMAMGTNGGRNPNGMCGIMKAPITPTMGDAQQGSDGTGTNVQQGSGAGMLRTASSLLVLALLGALLLLNGV